MENNNYFIHNAFIVNEGKVFNSDVIIKGGIIAKITGECDKTKFGQMPDNMEFIDATGLYLLPGVIDTHVHFRDPGLTYKGDMYTESLAAVAGGVTSVMDMPNVIPPTTTVERWQQKMDIAKQKMFTNYAFYLGATNTNLEELQKADKSKIAGIKVFLGASTGNMVVNDEAVLEQIFAQKNTIIATHCEDDDIIAKNTKLCEELFQNYMPDDYHCRIRTHLACLVATQKAVKLAQKYGTQLHILHVSTSDEIDLLSKDYPNITAEVCPSYLLFSDCDYPLYGNLLKCNPSIKTAEDNKALLQALKEGKFTTIGSDHAPHTLEEKCRPYKEAPSGIPMVEYSLPVLLSSLVPRLLKIQDVVKYMAHAPALRFGVQKRGFIREGYFADLVLVDRNYKYPVNVYSKCGWSLFYVPDSKNPQLFTPKILSTFIKKTFVNGRLVYQNDNGLEKGHFYGDPNGQPLEFQHNKNE
ncbi:MAG: dihydroorotase [Bacteroidales bacterium]|jgi:dihydroorotase|nr:dihydroorotase [Bacteroidales bacterium]